MASGDRIMVTRAKIGRIADAIREKTSTTGGIELDDMPDLIRSISGGGGGGGGGLIVKKFEIINEDILSIMCIPTDLYNITKDNLLT